MLKGTNVEIAPMMINNSFNDYKKVNSAKKYKES